MAWHHYKWGDDISGANDYVTKPLRLSVLLALHGARRGFLVRGFG
ncbi:MAG: hypothetical protein QGG17_02965 [Rhodospirillales bacterium]|jgi:hypothetical protein|nr:hypothetical protein [Rhodospirillales bacterium]MDP6804834.1 hypothetical protein [Rhodospirillales bacterium]